MAKESFRKKLPGESGKSVLIIVLLSVVVLLVAMDVMIFFGLVRQKAGTLNNNANTNSAQIGTINITDDPYTGGADSKVVIIEFGDFQCPFCLEAFPVVHDIISTYGDKIKFVYKNFPLADIHLQATKAAEAAECAFEQNKFWEMHDKMFINQSDLSVTALKRYAKEIGLQSSQFDQCLDTDKYATRVQADYNDGLIAGVPGTPTFFINGRMFPWPVAAATFKDIIDKLLVIYQQQP